MTTKEAIEKQQALNRKINAKDRERKIKLVAHMLRYSDDIQGELEWLLTYAPKDVVNELYATAIEREQLDNERI